MVERLRYIIIIPAIMFIVVGLLGCSSSSDLVQSSESKDDTLLATPDHPTISPSGKYQLQITEGFNGIVHFNRFSIAKVQGKDLEPKVIYDSRDIFRTRDVLYFLWDDKNRVWVYSGDLGTFYWTRISDDFWEKHAYADGNVSPPEFLKRVRPEYHTK